MIEQAHKNKINLFAIIPRMQKQNGRKHSRQQYGIAAKSMASSSRISRSSPAASSAAVE